MSQAPVALEPALITTITAPSVPDVCKETCDVLMQFRGGKCFIIIIWILLYNINVQFYIQNVMQTYVISVVTNIVLFSLTHMITMHFYTATATFIYKTSDKKIIIVTKYSNYACTYPSR